MNLGNSEAAEGRVADTDHEPQLAATDRRDHLIAADLVIAVDDIDPSSGDWDVEGNDGLRQGGQQRWLYGTGHRAVEGPDGQLHGVWKRVPNLRLERTSTGWPRRLDQGARGGEDGQREAEGDGPQHDDILALGNKAQTEQTTVPGERADARFSWRLWFRR